jgi:hypothetical protein
LRWKHEEDETVSYLILLDSFICMALLFTQYPRAGYYYTMYLMPFVLLPFVFVIDRALRRPGHLYLLRASNLGLVFFVTLAYVALRPTDTTVDPFGSRHFGLIEHDHGNLYYPLKEADYLLPVVDYIRTRPQQESFLAYDVFNIAIAFFTQRPIQVNYFQKHLFGGYGDQDILELENLAKAKKIDVIVLGKQYLSDTEQEKKLFQFLTSCYDLAFENSNHLVYQRK